MRFKRLAALVLVFLMMFSMVDPGVFILGYAEPAEEAAEIPESANKPSQDEPAPGANQIQGKTPDSAGVDAASGQTPSEADAALEASDAPVAPQEAPTESAEPGPEPEDGQTSEPLPEGPALFSSGVSHSVSISGDGVPGQEIVLALEMKENGQAWTTALNPNKDGGLYTINLVLNQAGEAQGAFALQGLPEQNEYRARVTEMGDQQDSNFKVKYANKKAGKGGGTEIRLKSTVAEEPSPSGESVEAPTAVPTEVPAGEPTDMQTEVPIGEPTEVPVGEPTDTPTEAPIGEPTEVPVGEPADTPTEAPTAAPTEVPVGEPTDTPTEAPTAVPTEVPVGEPTDMQTEVPIGEPTEVPAQNPTEAPQNEPETAVYESEVYSVSVSFAEVSDAGELEIALLMDAGERETEVARLSLTPNADGSALGVFALGGLPISASYRATAIRYRAESLTFGYDETYGGNVAKADGVIFREETDGLSLSVRAEPAPTTALIRMAAASVALLGSAPDAYALTLDLALNGGAPQSIPITFGLENIAGTYVCKNLSAAGSSVSFSGDETGVTITLKPTTPEGDPALTYTIRVTPENKEYTITPPSSGYAADSANGTFGENLSATATLSAMAQTSHVFNVNWNDNKAADRPTPTITLSADGVEQPSLIPVANQASFNLTQYTFTNLPKYKTGGEAIDYTATQAALDDYITTSDSNGVTNTLKTTFTVYKQWNDAATSAETRPSQDAWKDLLTFTQKSRKEGAAETTLSLAGSALTETESGWELTIPELPAYDEDGYPYDYAIKESTVPSGNTELGTYTADVHNVGIYAGKTTPGTAYDGGTLISTITDFTGFDFNKVWEDGGDTAGRPDVTFYLYRYPAGVDGQGFDTLAPVKGNDSKQLKTAEEKVDGRIEYASEGTLPRYDNEGYEYIYYLREVMTNAGDYKAEISNVGGWEGEDAYILPGATVTNVRKADTAVSFTKTWKAKALQSLNGSIRVELQRETASGTWEPVCQKEVTGFTAETMTLTDSFSEITVDGVTEKIPKYDAEGKLYKYRVREVAAELGGGALNTVENDAFQTGDYPFEVSYPEGAGISENTIYNTLVGTTELRVKKVWSPALSEGTESKITVRILRDGQSDWAGLDGVTSTGDTAQAAGGNFEITGTGDLETIFENLPRYDAEGREYVYTVQELVTTGATAPEGYSYYNTLYSVEEGGIKTATISNVQEPGETLTFDVEKNWLDDGDLLSRVPVTVGLFLEGDSEPIETAELTAADSWRTRIFHTPTEGQSGDADDYFIREIEGTTFTIDGDRADYISSGNGQVRSVKHIYKVTTQKDGNKYTITNLRVGKLEITAEKVWKINALTSEVTADAKIKASFCLFVGDEVTARATQWLTMGEDTSVTFADLDKYDDKGAIIPYIMRETTLQASGALGDDPEAFENGKIEWHKDEFIVSSVVPGLYLHGANLDDPDSMSYIFTNRLTGSTELSINKVWRDAGSDTSKRPDIRFSLYRSANGGEKKLVTSVRLWKTGDERNDWFWTCGFGAQDIFDADGNRYQYTVQETLLQKSDYVPSFYSGSVQPSASGTDSAGTFGVQPEENADGYAIAHSDETKTGTIINTLAGTRTVKGKKLWLNLPAWFQFANLPDVKMQLYRSTIEPAEDAMVLTDEELVAGELLTLADGVSSFEFADLPAYNEYGLKYYYAVKELDESEASFGLNGYDTKNSIKDTTVTNTYNQNGPKVTVTAKKTWDFTNSWVASQQKFPEVTFELHQVWHEGEADAHDAIVATQKIPDGDISDLPASSTATFTEDANGKALLRYAPDGTEFAYYIVEKAINGYTVCNGETDTPIDDPKIVVSLTAADADADASGTVWFLNKYDPETKSISATKRWDDQNDAFGTRPSISSASGPSPTISFTLYRKTKSSAEEEVAGASGAWEDGGAGNWEYSFSGTFPAHSTLGEAYTYYVKETLAEPYDSQYALSMGENTLALTNSLQTVSVEVDKRWTDANGSLLGGAQLTHLKDLGVMPDSVTFLVEYKDNTEWKAVQKNGADITEEVLWADLLAACDVNETITVATGLPKYAPDGVTERIYRVREIKIGTSDVVSNAADGFEIDHAEVTDADETSVITNKQAMRKLYFVKNWVDENDRDGVRPTSIIYTVKDENTSKTTDVTLTETTTSSDPSTDGAHIDAPNRWYAELVVPVTGDYTVTEKIVPNGYTVSEDSGSGTGDWFSFTNTHSRKTMSVTVGKRWNGDTSWKDETRPSAVEVHLEYRKGTTGAWINLVNEINAPDEGIPVGADAKKSITEGESWQNVQFTGLPVYAQKTEDTQGTVAYQYRVMETASAGYVAAYSQASVTGVANAAPTITVTNTLKTVHVSVEKVWQDEENKFGSRPASINVKLQRKVDGGSFADVSAVASKTLNAENSWKATFSNLPYENEVGHQYAYQVVEAAIPENYEANVSAFAFDATGATSTELGTWKGTLTNALKTPESLTATKTWDDANNAWATRPVQVTFHLQYRKETAPGVWTAWTETNPATTQTLIYSVGNQSVTFDDLPAQDADGKAYAYRAVEESIPNYTASQPSFTESVGEWTGTITNALNKTKSLTVTKEWQDANNLYLTRPTSDLTVQLQYRAGSVGTWLDAPVPTQVLAYNASDKTWASTTFSNLPDGNAAGVAYEYRAVEVEVPDNYTASYTAAGNVSTITNTLALTQSLAVSKAWDDESNAFASRPGQLKFQLQFSKDSGATWHSVGNPEILAPVGGVWGALRFENLPASDADGTPYRYRAVEVEVPGNYTATENPTFTELSEVWTGTVTNTLDTVSLTVRKDWADQNNNWAIRPEQAITVKLQYRRKGQTAWQENTPVRTQTLSYNAANASWDEAVFTNLPVQDSDGTGYEYRVVETNVPTGYQASSPVAAEVISNDEVMGYAATVTNTLETVSLTVQKEWADQDNLWETRPAQVTVKLQYRKVGVQQWVDAPVQEQELTAETGWTVRFDDLPEKDTDGILFEYQAVEVAVPHGYEASVSAGTITNTLKTVSLSVQKEWADQENHWGTRPTTGISVKLQYRKAGTQQWMDAPIADKTLDFDSANNTWMPAIFENLPEKAVDGTRFEYQAVETDVPNGYGQSVSVSNGTATLTNTLETVSVSGTKTWLDDDDRYHTRPDAITLTLYADDREVTNHPGAVWDRTGDAWTYRYEDLPRYNVDGGAIVYTVRETPAIGYAASAAAVGGSVDADTGNVTSADFTNTLETVSVSGTKTWLDDDDRYHTRPDAITLTLYADDREVSNHPGAVWDRTGDAWTYRYEDLPRYNADGSAIVYTVQEIPAIGYAASSAEAIGGSVDANTGNVTGADFTNTLETVSVSGTKTWLDDGNRYGIRPDSIHITLYANGEMLAPQPDPLWEKPEGADVWTYVYAALPRYDSDTGEVLVYTIEEDAVTGYAPSMSAGSVDLGTGDVTALNVTNTLQTVSVSGTKRWEDNENARGTRPEGIDLTLYGNGEMVNPQPTPSWDRNAGANEWTYAYAGLPRYDAHTGMEIVYTVRETTVSGYHEAPEQYGTVDAETGDVTRADFENRLIRRLEIDNITVNAATHATNAGGFVAVDGVPNERDKDPYQDDQVRVRWRPDEYWENGTEITVAFLEHGADPQTGWRQVTVSPDNLASLKAIDYFSDAVIEEENGRMTLRLADDYRDMPYMTRVLVSFRPTLAVENTTVEDKGGTVWILKQNPVRDGRYPSVTAYGQAQTGYKIDIRHLQLSAPLGVRGSVDENSGAVSINPDAAGNFATVVGLTIAGRTEQITITGTVNVIRRDAEGNPVEVSITVNGLPASMDIGIPFLKPDEANESEGDIPQTGDAIYWGIALFILSGALLLLVRKKR